MTMYLTGKGKKGDKHTNEVQSQRRIVDTDVCKYNPAAQYFAKGLTDLFETV